MVVRLLGPSIRPRDLSWIGATSASQWLAVLRANTPLGGIYLCGAQPNPVSITLEVVNEKGEITVDTISAPRYLYPNEVLNRTADLREILADQKSRVSRGLDVSKAPPKFTKLNGIWGEWSGQEILGSMGDTPIRARLEENERALVLELGLTLRIFLAFSTDLWDNYNDNVLRLRKGHRLLRGGLQLSTKHMPQGLPLTIPMTNNIGFQNLAHVLVHFDNAEPDLGRKGFQPEVVRVAEKLSVSAVTALRRFYGLLRKPGGAQRYDDELKIDQWRQEQIRHEMECPLLITGAGLFMPTEELPIRSEPVVEQDVVSLFNQMLSSGLIRGLQLISSSQFRQYDGLFRVKMTPPLDRYVLSKENPLGIDREHFIERESIETVVKVLEYKFNVDGLVEEIQAEVKAIEDIGLVVAWELGSKWRQMFDVMSYLDEDNVHHRTIHGATHAFTHSITGANAFQALILKDLVGYLVNPEAEQRRQREKLTAE